MKGGRSNLERKFIDEVDVICSSDNPEGLMARANLTPGMIHAISNYLDVSEGETFGMRAESLGLTQHNLTHAVSRGLARFRLFLRKEG